MVLEILGDVVETESITGLTLRYYITVAVAVVMAQMATLELTLDQLSRILQVLPILVLAVVAL
jgi:ABC-type nitrate/sulfonate/bicarbonate transport system permease component